MFRDISDFPNSKTRFEGLLSGNYANDRMWPIVPIGIFNLNILKRSIAATYSVQATVANSASKDSP